MANVEINDIAARTTLAATDEFEGQLTGGGASFKATLANIIASAAHTYGMLSVQGGSTSQDNIDTTPILMTQWTTDGLSNGMTVAHAADTIVATIAGKYSVDCSFSFSGTNGATVILEIYVYDDSGTSWAGSGFKMERKLGSVDVGSSSLNGLVTLAVDDKVAIYIASGATDDVTVKEAQMIVKRISA